MEIRRNGGERLYRHSGDGKTRLRGGHLRCRPESIACRSGYGDGQHNIFRPSKKPDAGRSGRAERNRRGGTGYPAAQVPPRTVRPEAASTVGEILHARGLGYGEAAGDGKHGVAEK